MEKRRVMFESRVDIIKPAPGSRIMMVSPDHDLNDDSFMNSPDSADLEMSQLSLSRVNSTGHSTYGLLHSTQRGTTNYNYGYSSPLDEYDDSEHRKTPNVWTNSSATALGIGCKRVVDQDRQQRSRRRTILAFWACIAVISLLIAAVLATVLTWCIIIPRRPGLQVLDGSTVIKSLNVSRDVNLILAQNIATHNESARLSANFTFQLLVRNPNRVATDYSATSFSVAYRDTVLGKASLPAFSQRTHATTQWGVESGIVDVLVSNPNAYSLLREKIANDSVSLQVEGRVHARLQILGISTPPVVIGILCSIEMKVSELKVSDQRCHLTKRKFFG